jgi:hypothetical protein
MRVAITFRDQPERECRGNEYDYPSFNRREAESLPYFIELETSAFFNHEYFYEVFLFLLVRCRAVAWRGGG